MKNHFVSGLVVTLFIGTALFLVSCSKKDVIKEGEAGIVVSNGGDVTVYSPGDRPSVVPFLNKYYVVSTKPEVISFVKDEAMHVPSSSVSSRAVESQVTYFIEDVSLAVQEFGVQDIHQNIKKAIKDDLESIIKEEMADPDVLLDSKKRALTIANVHLRLNEVFKKKGVSITNYELGY